MRWLALSAVALAVGCERAPDDPVFFFGTATTATGTPLEGAEVQLFRGEGTTCRDEMPGWPRRLAPPREESEDTVEQLGSTESSEAGAFLLRLFGYQVAAGILAESDCFLATLEPAPSGALSVVSFGGFGSDVVIEDFYRWDDGVLQVEGETVLAPAFPVPPSLTAEFNGPIRPNLFAYGWQVTVGDDVLWRERATGHPLDLNHSGLEATQDPLTVHLDLLASITPEGVTPFTGVSYRLIARTAPLDVPASAAVPVSRGSTCAWGDAPAAPCTLTDGAFVPIQYFPGEEQPYDTPFQLTLPESAHLREVVLRGFSPGSGFGQELILEGSTDGTTWTPLLELPFSAQDPDEARPYAILNGQARFERHALPATEAPIQHLRITGLRVFSMSELSFFE